MKRLVVVLVVLVLTLTFAPTAFAGTQGSCTPNGNSVSLRLWENEINDTSDGNDTVWIFCNRTAPAKWSDLSQLDHTLPGGCHSIHPLHGPNWNDCVDSYTIWGMASSLWRICWWKDAGYMADTSFTSGPLTNGSRHDFFYTFGEEISAIKVTNGNTCAG